MSAVGSPNSQPESLDYAGHGKSRSMMCMCASYAMCVCFACQLHEVCCCAFYLRCGVHGVPGLVIVVHSLCCTRCVRGGAELSACVECVIPMEIAKLFF